MSNLKEEIYNIAQLVKKELSNNEGERNMDNVEAYRSKLENLKMQNTMQLNNSEESLRKYLKEFEDGEFKTSILNHLDNDNPNKEEELEKLKELNKKFVAEYEAKIEEFIKNLDN